MRATQSIVTASHAATSGTNALLASQNSDWIIDSVVSFHMYGTQNSVSITDGRTCLVAGEGVIHTFSQIILEKIFFVPDFPINLLSISAITKQLLCYVTFFLFHCTFQDLQT